MHNVCACNPLLLERHTPFEIAQFTVSFIVESVLAASHTKFVLLLSHFFFISIFNFPLSLIYRISIGCLPNPFYFISQFVFLRSFLPLFAKPIKILSVSLLFLETQPSTWHTIYIHIFIFFLLCISLLVYYIYAANIVILHISTTRVGVGSLRLVIHARLLFYGFVHY